jgi:HEAT repeat protein
MLERVPDITLLQEMLRDRQNPRGQSQAALLLVQSNLSEAEAAIRQGLQQIEDAEMFQAIALAIRLYPDNRFLDDVLGGLNSSRPTVRQTAAETLATLPDGRLLARLYVLINDVHADLASRQAAVWVLGRCGRKRAMLVLLELLENDNDTLRRAAAESLAELTGQNYGLDVTRWQTWWDRHKDMTPERWLEHRLAYQSVRTRRLESELERTRAQVLRLHQQLYSRLPVGERVGYIQSVAEQEEPAIRLLAVTWVVEQLAAADTVRQQALAQVLLRLSQDGALEVQRAAVLALGRFGDPAGFERLRALLQQGRATVRAAAARSLAQQSRGNTPEARERQKLTVPTLQKALDDPALEVVVEAAEALGTLGAGEAGPILTALLTHPSGNVRQTAAQALERVADVSLIDGLLKGLNDPNVNVRFSLLGAIARALGRGVTLAPGQYSRLMSRLETLVLRDVDPGVRSRAATVLGECGPPAVLPLLWQCVRSAEDSRVQEKAWSAFIEVIVRSGKVALLQEWDRTLSSSRQSSRRVQLLTEVSARWHKNEETRHQAISAQDLLVQTELELGKWSSALAHLRELLMRPSTAAEQTQRLKWLLTAGEQALQEGNRTEAQKVVSEAQPFLSASSELAPAFERLAQQAGKKE